MLLEGGQIRGRLSGECQITFMRHVTREENMRRHAWMGVQVVALCFLSYSSMSVVRHPALGQVRHPALNHENQQLECDNKAPNIKAVAVPPFANGEDGIIKTDFNAIQPDGGRGELDPPLLQTAIRVEGKRKSCIIAHFSAMVHPRDNYTLFQVSVDGVAMAGNMPFPGSSPTAQLVAWESTLTPSDLTGAGGLPGMPGAPAFFSPTCDVSIGCGLPNIVQMMAYNFFAEVDPGDHTVEVSFAKCCSTENPP